MIGNDGRCFFHNGFPVRVGFFSNQDLARLKLVELIRLVDQTHGTAADPLTDRIAGRQRGPLLQKTILKQYLSGPLRLHRFGAGLQNEKLACDPILGEFDIHRCRMPAGLGIVPFNLHRPPGQLQNIIVQQGKPLACFPGYGDVAGGRLSLLAAGHSHLFFAKFLLNDGAVIFFQSGLEHHEFIRVHRSLDDVLTQTPGCMNQHGVRKACFSIYGKDHTAGTLAGGHHSLDADGKRHLKMVKSLVHSIRDGPIGKQRGITTSTGVPQGNFTDHIQVRFLLSREAGVGQVFCCGAAAYGNRHRLLVLPRGSAQASIACRDGLP